MEVLYWAMWETVLMRSWLGSRPFVPSVKGQEDCQTVKKQEDRERHAPK